MINRRATTHNLLLLLLSFTNSMRDPQPQSHFSRKVHTSPRNRSIVGHRDHLCVGNVMTSSRGQREEREEEDGVLQVLLQEFVRHGLDEPFYEACSCADRKAGHAWFAKHQERWGRAMLSTAKV